MKSVQTCEDVLWVARLAREHLDCRSASAVFKESPLRVKHSSCGQPHFDLPVLREVFTAHLQRCAQAGCVADSLELGVQAQTSHYLHDYMSRRRSAKPNDHAKRPCRITRTNILALDQHCSSALATILLSTRRELPAISKCLSTMPACQLADLLSEEVLQALGHFAEHVVAALASDRAAVTDWVTPRRLAVLPGSCQKVAATMLLPHLDNLGQDVADAITQVLS